MRAIRQRVWFCGILTGFSMAACILIFFLNFLSAEIQTQQFLLATSLMSGLLACLWVREYKRLKIAQLIVENQILYIQSAVINDCTYDIAESEVIGGIEVFISNFGILLDSNIIKFNQGDVRLKAVKIGRDFISLAYGTDKRMQITRLLSTPIGERELADIVEKFRYETGVMPELID